MLSRYRRALLILAALGLLASQAWGQQPAPPNPDLLRFLQGLSSESASAVRVSESPEADCNAWTSCLTWGAVQCQGSACITYPGCGVQCDNVTYSCPLADPEPDPCW